MTDEIAPIGWLGAPVGLGVDKTHGPVAFGPGGLLAAGTREIRVWSIPSGELRCAASVDDLARGFCFTPDGARLLLTTRDRLLRVSIATGEVAELFRGDLRGGCVMVPGEPWVIVPDNAQVNLIHVDTGVVERQHKPHRATVYGVDAAGELMATASGKVARVFDGLRGARLGKARRYKGARNPLLRVTLSADGALLLAGDNKGWVLVWDVASEELLWEGPGRGAAFTPDGQRVIANVCVKYDDDDVRWSVATLDARTGDRLAQFPAEAVSVITLSDDGALVAYTTTQAYAVALWDLAREERLLTGTGHRNTVGAVIRAPERATLLSSSTDGLLAEWPLDGGDPIRSLRTDGVFMGTSTLALSGDGAWLACAEGLRVHLRAMDTWEARWSWSEDLNDTRRVIWLKDDAVLMVLCAKKYKGYARIFFLDAATGAPLASLERLDFEPRDGWEEEGRAVVVGSGYAIVIDLDTFDIVRRVTLAGRTAPTRMLNVTHREALVFGPEILTELVEIDTGASRVTLESVGGVVATCFAGDDEEVVVIADHEDTLHLMDRRDGRRFRSLHLQLPEELDSGTIRLHRVSGACVATSWKDGRVALWDTSEWQPPQRAQVDREGVNPQLTELRALLHLEPDKGTWTRLCDLLSGWEASPQLALDYAAPHLEAWPDALRVLPRAWLAALLFGQRTPLAALARVVHEKEVFDATVPMLVAAPELSELVHLRVGGAGLQNDGAKALAAAEWPKLRELSITSAGLRITGARALAKAPFMAGLRTLLLRNTPIQGKGAAALVASPALSGLDTLSVFFCDAADEHFARALTEARHLAGLKKLELGFKRAFSLAPLTAASHLSALESFSIFSSGRRPGDYDDQLEAFTQAEHLSGLRALRLDGVRVNDANLVALARAVFAPSLEDLNVYMDWSVGAESIERFRDSFPKLNPEMREHLTRVAAHERRYRQGQT